MALAFDFNQTEYTILQNPTCGSRDIRSGRMDRRSLFAVLCTRLKLCTVRRPMALSDRSWHTAVPCIGTGRDIVGLSIAMLPTEYDISRLAGPAYEHGGTWNDGQTRTHRRDSCHLQVCTNATVRLLRSYSEFTSGFNFRILVALFLHFLFLLSRRGSTDTAAS